MYHETQVIDAASGREFNISKLPEERPGRHYVFAKLEVFKDAGVSAEDVIREMRPSDCSMMEPTVARLIECYDLQVLDQCYEKYASWLSSANNQPPSREEYEKYAFDTLLKCRGNGGKIYKERFGEY